MNVVSPIAPNAAAAQDPEFMSFDVRGEDVWRGDEPGEIDDSIRDKDNYDFRDEEDLAAEESVENEDALEDYYAKYYEDERVYSDDPHDWDLVEDLCMATPGYFNLPRVYLELRDLLPCGVEKTFFDDGIFWSVKPGTSPADAYLEYCRVAEEGEPKEAKENWRHRFYANLGRLHRLEREGEWKTKNYKPLSLDNMKKEVSEVILCALQDSFAARPPGPLALDELKAAYDLAVCGNANVEKAFPFDGLLREPVFIDCVKSWRHAQKVARHIPELSEMMERKLHKGLAENKRKISRNWHEKYKDYEPRTQKAAARKKYDVVMKSFFQDIDAFQSHDKSERFAILKSDLFDPASDFNVNRLIEAFRNKDFAHQLLVVPEFLYIKDGKKEFRVLFGVNEDGKIWPIDENEILPDDSIYSLNDRAFFKVAGWHRDLKRPKKPLRAFFSKNLALLTNLIKGEHHER